MRRKIDIVAFTPRQISQKRAENALCACLPDDWQDSWKFEFRYQNELLRDQGDKPLSAAEFIKVKLENLAGPSNGSPF